MIKGGNGCLTFKNWNDTLNLTFLTNIFGPTGDGGGFQRFAAEYDLTDSVELTGGVVFFQFKTTKPIAITLT